jgi:hypothetical protein
MTLRTKKNRFGLAAMEAASFFGASAASAKKDRANSGTNFLKMLKMCCYKFLKKGLNKITNSPF